MQDIDNRNFLNNQTFVEFKQTIIDYTAIIAIALYHPSTYVLQLLRNDLQCQIEK